jgi:hypothetical protein
LSGFENADENIVLLNKPFRAQKLAEALQGVLV